MPEVATPNQAEREFETGTDELCVAKLIFDSLPAGSPVAR